MTIAQVDGPIEQKALNPLDNTSFLKGVLKQGQDLHAIG